MRTSEQGHGQGLMSWVDDIKSSPPTPVESWVMDRSPQNISGAFTARQHRSILKNNWRRRELVFKCNEEKKHEMAPYN